MADCSAAALFLGGPIPTIFHERLAAAMVEACAGSDYGEAWRDSDEAIEAIYAAETAEAHLAMFIDEAPGGQFGDLPALLQELGIPYVTSWDAHYAYSAGVKAWAPGMQEVDELAGDNNGNALVSRGPILRAARDGTVGALLARMSAFDPMNLPPVVITLPDEPAAPVAVDPAAAILATVIDLLQLAERDEAWNVISDEYNTKLAAFDFRGLRDFLVSLSEGEV